MKRFMVVMLAAGIVAAAGCPAFAQEGPRGPQRRGIGAGGPMGDFLKNLPEEKRAEIVKKLREATPEQRRQIMERLRAAAAPKDGEAKRPAPPAPPAAPAAPARRAAPNREGKAGAAPIRRWLRGLPAERREQIVARLRNASPEDRHAFVRRFAERARGAQNARRGQGRGGMQARRGMGQDRGGMQARRGRCRHCGEPQRGNREGARQVRRGGGRHGMQAERGPGRRGMQARRGMGRGQGGMPAFRGMGRGQGGDGMERRRPPFAPRGGGGRGFPIL